MNDPIGLTFEERVQLLVRTVRAEMRFHYPIAPAQVQRHIDELCEVASVMARRLSYEPADDE